MQVYLLERLVADGSIESQRFSVAGWRILVGEILLAAAVDVPLLETPIDTLAKLLGQPLSEDRSTFSPIQQAILGAQDLTFGGYVFRPDRAGLNDRGDVSRMVVWLQAVDPTRWSSDNLPKGVDASSGELAFAKEWFPELVRFYDQAAKEDSVIVCEDPD